VAFLDRRADHAAATRLDDVTADDLIGRPIGALHENVRLEARDDSVRRVLVEDDDGIDRCERRNDLGALGFGVDRATGPLVGADRPIGVDADDERVAFGARRLQVAHVAGMQDVVDPVGEHHRPVRRAQRVHETDGVLDRQDVRDHVRLKNMYVPTSCRG
jgi:hypothetical protein